MLKTVKLKNGNVVLRGTTPKGRFEYAKVFEPQTKIGDQAIEPTYSATLIMNDSEEVQEFINQLQGELEKATGLAEEAQRASDFASMCERFEKRLADLEITRTISVQMAPQIRLIQNSDNLMIEKIQTTINNTIPLWKNQMVLALGLAHSEQAVAAQSAVTEATNDLLKKNAETLHTGAVEIAKESERSIVDLETVRFTNEQLMATLDEVLAIQEEGHAKRVEAEAALAKIENELREKLLSMTKTGQNSGLVEEVKAE